VPPHRGWTLNGARLPDGHRLSLCCDEKIRGEDMNSRTQIAETVLVEYHRLKREPLECMETSIIDLMTDMLHLAHKEELDGISLSKMVRIHFEAEMREAS